MRRTTVDYVMAFGRYAPDDVEVTYHNVARPTDRTTSGVGFDALVLTYDLLSMRQASRWASIVEKLAPLAQVSRQVIAIPQDDYTYNEVLDSALQDLGTTTIFTPIETGLEIVYPNMSKRANLEFCLTGYVDEDTVHALDRYRKPMRERNIDVGQRVRMLPAWFGREAREKGLFAERFREKSRGLPIVTDISTDDSDTFSGDDWFRFLGSSKSTLGQKGGASLCDPDGSIMRRVVEYTAHNPDSKFEEIERKCFPGLDGKALMRAVSPRLFDAAMLYTAQILVEDDYLGVLEPWVHYIPTDRDLSNLGDIVKALKDDDLLERITGAAYETLACSDRFTYRAFVNQVLSQVTEHQPALRIDHGVDLAEELQWRLTPQLFEAVQRCAYLGSATETASELARLAERIAAILTEMPFFVRLFDLALLERLSGSASIHPTIDRHLPELTEVLVECYRAGAIEATIKWLRYVDSAHLLDWELIDWVDWHRVQLDTLANT